MIGQVLPITKNKIASFSLDGTIRIWDRKLNFICVTIYNIKEFTSNRTFITYIPNYKTLLFFCREQSLVKSISLKEKRINKKGIINISTDWDSVYVTKDGRLFLRNRDNILGIVLINVHVMQIETIIHFYSLFQLNFEGNYMTFLEEDSSTIIFSCQNGILIKLLLFLLILK